MDADTIWALYGCGFFIGILVVIFNHDQHGWLWKFSCIFLIGWLPKLIYTWGNALFGKKHTMSIAGFLILSIVLIVSFPVGPFVYWMTNKNKGTRTTAPGTSTP